MYYLYFIILLTSLLVPSTLLPLQQKSKTTTPITKKIAQVKKANKKATLPIRVQKKAVIKVEKVATKANAKASISSNSKTTAVAKTKKTVAAWFPYWDQKNATNSFRRNKKIINEISPYWYFVKSNGKLAASSKFNMKIIDEAKKANIKVIPMVSNDFNGEMMSKILRNQGLRRTHINELVNKVVKRDLDGIDLDYEGLLAKDRDLYSSFIQIIANKLHKHKKLLSVTVQAKTKEPGPSKGTQAADWKKIGKYADKVQIMAYDYHWKTSSPGPIAPKYWVDAVAEFAAKTIPSKKVILAIGTYGYNWKGGRAQAITTAQVRQLSKKTKQPIRRDKASHEQFLKIGKGKPRIWLQDSGALDAKLKIVNKYNLGGIIFWRLGDEDPKTWSVVKKNLK